MRLVAARIVLICLASAPACTSVPPQPPVVTADGVMRYTTSRTIQKIDCDGRPIDLAGSRTEMTVAGPCRFVRVSGDHNDIMTDIVPAGTIEIAGGHNDVSWRQIGPGPRPDLQDHGERNSFHRISIEP
jgi:Protein of unknown function (DUF3060)